MWRLGCFYEILALSYDPSKFPIISIGEISGGSYTPGVRLTPSCDCVFVEPVILFKCGDPHVSATLSCGEANFFKNFKKF